MSINVSKFLLPVGVFLMGVHLLYLMGAFYLSTIGSVFLTLPLIFGFLLFLIGLIKDKSKNYFLIGVGFLIILLILGLSVFISQLGGGLQFL